MAILDSGERREFETGAVRDISGGKGRMDLVPLDAVGCILEDAILTDINSYVRKGDKMCLVNAIKEFAGAYFENMYEYIQNLDEDIKTSEETYEKRLAICKECDYLLEGMCRACGCFVELRASIQNNVCSYAKW